MNNVIVYKYICSTSSLVDSESPGFVDKYERGIDNN